MLAVAQAQPLCTFTVCWMVVGFLLWGFVGHQKAGHLESRVTAELLAGARTLCVADNHHFEPANKSLSKCIRMTHWGQIVLSAGSLDWLSAKPLSHFTKKSDNCPEEHTFLDVNCKRQAIRRN